MKVKNIISAGIALAIAISTSCQATGRRRDAMPTSSREKNTFKMKDIEIKNPESGMTLRGSYYLPDGKGQKPLIITAHELGSDGARPWWVNYANHWAAEGYAVLCVDFSGGGQMSRSDGETTDMSVLTEVSDLETVLAAALTWDTVDKDNVILVGGSQGGGVATIIAARHPETVKSLVLMYPAFYLPEDLHRRYPDPENLPETDDRGMITIGRRYITDMYDYDYKKDMRSYPGPVLIVHGDNDTVVSLDGSKEAVGIFPSASLHVIEGAGHVFMTPPQQEEFLKVADEFLSGSKPGGGKAKEATRFVDADGEAAYVPAGFTVSGKKGENTVKGGLVVTGPDGSEYVWIPVGATKLAVRDWGKYFYGEGISGYRDETSLASYKAMVKSVGKYGGFYIGRYEASYGGGKSRSDYVPASKPVTKDKPGRVWVHFSPQDATVACENLYRDNPTVQGFLLWGINWDTALQWLIDSGNKTRREVADDSSGWGNYSNDTFARGTRADYTGAYEEAKAGNIYDLAGNNWEWTQERYGSSYVMRGGGSSIMGGACPGDWFPAAFRDPLPGNSHHPNVTFRAGLFIK